MGKVIRRIPKAETNAAPVVPVKSAPIIKKKPKPIETPHEKKWVVSLPFGPKVVVTAADQETAYEAYKRVCGITGSDHSPTITVLGPDNGLRINEHGVVIESQTMAASAVEIDELYDD